MKGRRARRDHLDGKPKAANPIPSPLEFASPIFDSLDLVQQNHRTVLALRDVLCLMPKAFPPTRDLRLRPIGGRVKGRRPEGPGQVEENRRLPDLTWPDDELDPARGLPLEPRQDLARAIDGIEEVFGF
jgi:hypothetical protein